ncbi:MAG TPA: hypothetical protein VF665_25595 [Longimicrobium sp.]|jgi:hypothetical protein|uniref:hypothetical protein n=1 Tax=Longimicrobium sp. TaxID=2029185 RepID=UPI002EDACF83
MIKRLILSMLARAERQFRLPGSMDYMRMIAGQSTPAFLKFSLFLPLSAHRTRVPVEVWFAARLAATRAQDCGTCVQMVVNDALNRRVPPALVRDVVAQRMDALPAAVADAYAFGRAVAEQDVMADVLRERIIERHGEGGLVELSIAIASAQVFPITKRALGMAQSCSLVAVEVPAPA